jgi:hypothetical protein
MHQTTPALTTVGKGSNVPAVAARAVRLRAGQYIANHQTLGHSTNGFPILFEQSLGLDAAIFNERFGARAA